MSCLYAFGGCAAFCFIFEMRRWKYILCAAGIGMVAQVVYLLLADFSTVSRLLMATVVTAALAEVFARIMKTPATVFLIIGILAGLSWYLLGRMAARHAVKLAQESGDLPVKTLSPDEVEHLPDTDPSDLKNQK